MTAMSGYDTKSKDDLLAIAKARGLPVTQQTNKSEIITALEEDDKVTEDAATAIQPPSPLPPKTVSQIPYVKPADSPDFINPAQPLDHEYTEGIFIKNDGAAKGEEFALCVSEPDSYHYHCTHFLKNTVHFWSGTKEQFKQQFDRK